jgi:hypothetical protein
MLSSSKTKAVSSLRALRCKVNLDALTSLQSLLLLQMLVGVSRTVNGSLSRSQAMARTLLLNGQQRLRDLLASAPRLNLPLERLIEICRSGNIDGDSEETAARALLEMCLGLMLQWMAEDDRRQRNSVMPARRRPTLPLCPLISYFLSSRPLFILYRPPTARSCPHVPLV